MDLSNFNDTKIIERPSFSEASPIIKETNFPKKSSCFSLSGWKFNKNRLSLRNIFLSQEFFINAHIYFQTFFYFLFYRSDHCLFC